ncbi:peroxiredoxin-like family protein [Jannaschia pohangensis]|uniref:Peroxiredoxin n=1 Tax=Jannaschia pohangensis TaxID=390807 RepID=A0A1I3QZF8_9RHOB|nr:peroxiredoxin-like family protein [Jannaschia pohangensis]SFJ38829.1 Peroxiredoxin [Jannaschia pohangensis]
MLKIDHAAPALSFPLLGGGTFRLSDESPDNFTLVLFYRGLHCPLCRKQIEGDVVPNLGKLAELGVEIVAVSMDDKDRAEKQAAEWGFGDLRVGYGLSEASAREWGLYMSSARPDTAEPAIFNEPGMTLVRPDGKVFANWQQSVPFSRPLIADLLGGLNFVINNHYPPRGTAT